MARRPLSGTRLRLGLLGGLAGGMAVTILVATAASAAISGFNPSSGTVNPGGSTKTDFGVSTPLLSCLTATVPLGFNVSMTGLGVGLGPLQANCVVGNGHVTMTVTAPQNAAPGNYKVTITEVQTRLLQDDLIKTYEWPFTVEAPLTTTTSSTTSSTTTTTSTTAPTTSSTSTTSTSTTSSTTSTTPTTAPGPTIPAPSTTAPTGPTTIGPTATTTSTSTTSSLPDPDSTVPDETDDSDAIAAPAPGDTSPGVGSGSGAVVSPDPESSLPVSVSERLRDRLAGALPLPLAEAVLSPLVIAEFLFRAVLSSALGYLIPLLVAGVIGGWMVLRMRREVTSEELAL